MSPAVVAITLAAGGVATVLRYLVSYTLARTSQAESFPWAVLLVNAVGSALGGVVLGLAQTSGVSEEVRLIILTGVCGGLTTFSTFSVETIQLITHERWGAAILNVGSNLVVGFGACLAAYLVYAS